MDRSTRLKPWVWAAAGSTALLAFVACASDGATDASATAVIAAPDAGLARDAAVSDAAAPAPQTHVVKGTVDGLGGTGLSLSDGSETLTLAPGARVFAFRKPIADGAGSPVTVTSQPLSPAQTCAVEPRTGTASAYLPIAVTCTTNTYFVSVNTVGVAGSGLVLQDNGGDDLAVRAGAPSVTFATPIASGAAFAVTIRSQPGDPSQLCTLSGASGTVVAGGVASVTLVCSTRYAVGGTVTGLAGTGLVLRNNGGDDLAVNANGTFAFATPLLDAATYAVTVQSNPTGLSQTCAVSGGDGAVRGAPVTSVAIACTTNSFTVGGTVTGLAGSGLLLQDNGGDDLAVGSDGSFTFATSVLSGATYAVTASSPTSPWQTCDVALGNDTMQGANVTNVAVTCTTNAYDVGGTVIGLLGSGLVIANQGFSLPAINADGPFATGVTSGASYAFTVLTQPTAPAQTCVISHATGPVGGAAVTNVLVSCQRILLVAADVPEYVADVQSTLLATHAFGGVDIFDASTTGAPTLATLQQYSAVLVWSDELFQDQDALGDVLADYFDAGGHVVVATFANTNAASWVGGRWSSGGYDLIALADALTPGSDGPLTIVDPTSPLVAGVTTLATTAAFESRGGPINGGVVVARWGRGGALIVSGVKNGHNHVELNMFPPSYAARSDFWVGDGAAIMRDALTYR